MVLNTQSYMWMGLGWMVGYLLGPTLRAPYGANNHKHDVVSNFNIYQLRIVFEKPISHFPRSSCCLRTGGEKIQQISDIWFCTSPSWLSLCGLIYSRYTAFCNIPATILCINRKNTTFQQCSWIAQIPISWRLCCHNTTFRFWHNLFAPRIIVVPELSKFIG